MIDASRPRSRRCGRRVYYLRAIVLGLCLCVPHFTQAQGQILGAVRGVVTDQQGAMLPGVLITAVSFDSGGTYAATTDAIGFYSLLHLPPGQYRITAVLHGFAPLTRDSFPVRAGMNHSLDLSLPLGDVTEGVVVQAEASLLESRNATQGINISGSVQRQLPLSSKRDWSSALTLAAGIVSTERSGTTFYQLHGADSGSQVFQVDGADVGAASTSSQDFFRASVDIIQDVQIKTAASDPSTPLGLGAIVNVTTRSGTDAGYAGAHMVYRPRKWNGRNEPGGTSAAALVSQPDVYAAGPLVKKHLWLFGAYRRESSNTSINRSAEQLSNLAALDPSFEDVDATERGYSLFLKPTLQFAPSHTLSVSVESSRLTARRGTPSASERTKENLTTGSVASLRLDSTWGQRLVTRGTAFYNNKAAPLDMTSDVPSQPVYAATTSNAGRVTGVGVLGILGAETQSGVARPIQQAAISVDASLHVPQLIAGSHDIHVGIYAQPWLNTRAITRYINSGFTLEEHVLLVPGDLSAGTRPFHRRIYDNSQYQSLSNNASDIGWYLQHVWTPLSTLSVSAGLRFDRIRRHDRLFDVPVQSSLEIGPRIGVNYAFDREGLNRLRGQYGRVHERLSQGDVSVGALAPTFTDTYDTDGDGRFDQALVTPGGLQAASSRQIDLNERHQPFVDEFSVAYERQWPLGFVTSISAVQRAYKDRTALVEINGRYDGERFLGYHDESQNEVYLVTNNRWNYPLVRDLQLAVSRHTATTALVANYVRQWRHIAGTWQPGDPATLVQPLAFANNKGIGSTSSPTSVALDANSMSGTNMIQNQSASQWRDHVVRIGGSWQTSVSVQVSATYTFQSGTWSGPVYTRVDPDHRFGPATITLSTGRVVSNPLATTFRFAGATRGSGQLRLPDYHLMNLRVARSWRLGGRRQLEVGLSVFNALNSDATQLFGTPNWAFSPTFGTTIFRQPPRSGQLEVGIRF